MLLQLSILNFAIVKTLDIDFKNGMTAITGETGAGKSIAIDALGLCLGDRAEAGMVRTGADKAQVTASFDVSRLQLAVSWLTEHDLYEDGECVIRRVISAEGRSKAYINGTPVALQQLKQLGQLLVSIHGQHAHQQLLKPEVQSKIVDEIAAHPKLLNAVADTFTQLKSAEKRMAELQANLQSRADRRQLLEYQVKELDEFDIQPGEFSQLESDHKKLSHSQTLLEQAQLSFHQLYEAEEGNALQAVQNSLDRISSLQEHDASLSPIVELLNEALINIDEACTELRGYAESVEIDPLKMQQVEARYSQALEFARKHQIKPEELYAFHQTIAQEFAELSDDDAQITTLAEEVESLRLQYIECAKKLSASRSQAAKKLSRNVEQQIQLMNMEHAKFSIVVDFEEQMPPAKSGLDNISFTIATNAGQTADKLEKVVSGGELSRVGLAIQVISSSKAAIPTMIFDEVDSGISGPTASVVGQLLKKLGNSTQVMCVTHLPQVAACAHQQMYVSKQSDKQSTQTQMISLSENERIDELARLLAGDKLTDSAVANAKALLNLH